MRGDAAGCCSGKSSRPSKIVVVLDWTREVAVKGGVKASAQICRHGQTVVFGGLTGDA